MVRVLGIVSVMIVTAFVHPSLAAEYCDAYLKEKAPPGVVVVYSKAEQRLCYFVNGRVAFSHRASHGREEGPKECQGDGKTPEGRYSLRVSRPSSGVPIYKMLADRAPGFFKKKFMALHKQKGRVKLWPTFMLIDYPNAAQRRQARKRCKKGDPGDSVGIHGSASVYKWVGAAQSLANHSDGCIVLDRKAMKRFEALVTRKTPILILPDD
jgi:murein L,D-transpeptidase YafK